MDKPKFRYEKCEKCGNVWNVSKYQKVVGGYICPNHIASHKLCKAIQRYKM